jgi:hypothetical protein
MNSDEERLILDYMKSCGEAYLSPSEIARRANARLFREDPRWALPFLQRLSDARLIESDPNGHYRYIDYEAREKKRQEDLQKRMDRW